MRDALKGVPCRHLSLFLLSRQQFLLTLRTPPIPADATRRGDDTVTGNREGYGIRGARASDRANSARPPNRRGHFGVRARLTARDVAQRGPDLPLKRCRANIERKIEPRNPAAKMVEHLPRPLRQRSPISPDGRGGILV